MSGILEQLIERMDAQTEEIGALRAAVAKLEEKIAPSRETFALRDIAELPESPSLKSLQNARTSAPWKLPGRGKPDGFARDGQAAWTRETVEAWRRELQPTPFGRARGRQRIAQESAVEKEGA